MSCTTLVVLRAFLNGGYCAAGDWSSIPLYVPNGHWLSLALVLMSRTIAAQDLPPDLVALSGRQLPKLMATAPHQITAAAQHNGMLVPVHVQIDQRTRGADQTWHYAFEAGDDPRPSYGGLGPDDLVILAVAEGGERMPAAPPDCTEIEVTDSSGGATRWFYLCRGATPSLPPLLRYDAETDRIAGVDYAISFSRRGTAVIDALVLGDPEHAANILDRSKARLDVDLALGIGSIHRSEDDVHVRTTGLHVGPLRIIRESEARGRMLLGLYSTPVRDNFIFYPHGFVLPTTIRLTPTARVMVRSLTLRISMALTEAARGMTFQSEPEMLTPTNINGRGGERGGLRPIGWYLLRRDGIGLLGWLQARPDIAREVTLYYRDDSAHPDPPETLAGEIGEHGFLFRHSGPLPSGEARLTSHAWVLHGEQLDHPTTTLRAFQTRPQAQVH